MQRKMVYCDRDRQRTALQFCAAAEWEMRPPHVCETIIHTNPIILIQISINVYTF